MKSIVCPVDFSRAATNAVAYAAKLAQTLPAALTLLHVQSVFGLPPSDIVRGTHMSQDSLRQALEAQAEEVERAFRVVCHTSVKESTQKLSTVIHEETKSFDLVVMGTSGPGDLYDLLFGTDTYNAIIKSETPMLVVPAGYVFRTITSIAYAFDYLRNRTLPLKQLLPLAERLGCKITVLQVMEESYSPEADGELTELQYILSTYLQQGTDLKFDTVRDADIANGINGYMQRSSHEVLALCTEHHSLLTRIFHKSVIRTITSTGSYPVIIFQQ
jgi:nucleotide-binding universal stress UspA family protein